MPDRPEMVLRLSRTLASLPPRDPLPLRLCRAVVEVVDARDGAISLSTTDSERAALWATSDHAARFEDAQDLLREGPSLEALRTGRPVVIASPEDRRRRWSGLDDAVADLAGFAVHVLPIRPGPSVIGVLTVHHPLPGTSGALVSDLQFLADAIGAALIDDLPDNDSPSGLWSERDRVSQATGMVVGQLGLAPDDALAVLRAHAFAQETTVLEISRRLVARELDFRSDRAGGSS